MPAYKTLPEIATALRDEGRDMVEKPGFYKYHSKRLLDLAGALDAQSLHIKTLAETPQAQMLKPALLLLVDRKVAEDYGL